MIRRAIKNEVPDASDLVSARDELYPCTKPKKKKGKADGPSVEVESLTND